MTTTNPAPKNARLGGSRVVARNALWNFAGRCGPLVIAVAATPMLVREFGVDRWGIFTLALSLVGIFGIFDLGIGRALSRLVAERLGAGAEQEAATAARTGLALVCVLGLAGGVLMAAFTPLVADLLKVPAALQGEVRAALWVLSLSVPLVLANAALWGILAAHQSFRAQNLLNIPIMALYYLGPLALWRFAPGLPTAIGVLVACRLAMTVGYAVLAARAMPQLLGTRLNWSEAPALMRQGAWMSVGNFISPVLTYSDRFLIAGIISVSATAYYSTSLDLVMRFWVIPVAIMNTAYPAIAASFRTDPESAGNVFQRSAVAIGVLVFPASLALVAGGDWILRLWLGADFSAHAAPVLRWLAAGALFSCLGFVPGGLLDGVGRPDVNAKFALAQTVVYVPCLMLLLHLFGITGAAVAWTLRMTVEWGGRLILAGRGFPQAAEAARRLGLASLAWAVALGLPLAFADGAARMICIPASLAIFAASTWLLALGGDDRRWLLAKARLSASLGRTAKSEA